jgi:transposase
MNHPSLSPDLNPIEFIWKIMKDQIEICNPKNVNELKILV